MVEARPQHAIALVACVLAHSGGLYLAWNHSATHSPLRMRVLEITFVPDAPREPPPPPEFAVLPVDAFTIHAVEMPAPEVKLAHAPPDDTAISSAPPPDLVEVTSEVNENSGYGPLVHPRVVTRPRVRDRYPLGSIRHRETGRVVVKICIAADGTVSSTDLIESSGFRRLDAAAVDMGLDYVFAPALRDGKAVPICLPYAIRFRIGGSRPNYARPNAARTSTTPT